MNYYSFHIGDYRRDTTHLSMLEHGAYRQLLDWLYLEEKPIPLDMEIVFRKLRAETEEEQKAIVTVLHEFFSKNKKGFTKNKCISQINNYKKRCEHNKKVGKLGGRPVSEITQKKPSGLLKETQMDSKNNPNHKPITNNHKPIKKENIKEKRFTPLARLTQLGIEKELAQDWLKHRQKKKAEVTETVLKILTAEAKKANVSLTDALLVSIDRNWVGFKADWYIENQKKNGFDVVAKPKEPDWRESEEGILEMGRKLNRPKLPHENLKDYRKILQDIKNEIRTH